MWGFTNEVEISHSSSDFLFEVRHIFLIDSSTAATITPSMHQPPIQVTRQYLNLVLSSDPARGHAQDFGSRSGMSTLSWKFHVTFDG